MRGASNMAHQAAAHFPSRPVALFVFLSAAAGAGIIAADFVVGPMYRGLRCDWFLSAVQGELGLWT